MKKIFSLGLVRGVIWGAIGVGAGMGFTMLVRLLAGLPAWEKEPVTAVGAIVGTLAFLAGAGAFTDWWRWSKGQEAGDPPHPPSDVPYWTRYFNFDANHKVIGIQYAVTSVLLLSVAGVLALILRTELVQSQMQFLTPDTYNHIMG